MGVWHRMKLRTFDKGKREYGDDLIPCPFTTDTKQALFKASDMDINEELLHHPENDPAYLGLKVNQGVAAQPMVNPNLRRVARRTYTVDEFVEGILRSDITCLSQAVTLVESNRPDHQAIAQQIIERCLPYAGKSMRIGITGVPGAGKST